MNNTPDGPEAVSLQTPNEGGNLRALIAANPRLAIPKVLEQSPTPLLKPRLTVLETIYHQDPGNDPTSFSSSSSTFLETPDQPCIRRLRVGESLQPLGTWLQRVSEIALRNDEGIYRVSPGKPTLEEIEQIRQRVVEVWSSGQLLAFLRPGRSCRFEPGDFNGLRLRCQCGQASVTVAAFPS